MIRVTIALSLLSGLGILTACAPTITEDNAAQVMADTVCKKEKKCRPDEYNDRFDDHADCADDYEDGYDAVISTAALFGFEIDVEETQSCHADLRAATCEEYLDGGFSNDCDDLFSF